METQTMLADQLHASLLDAADRHNAAQALVWLDACRRLTADAPEPAACRRLFSVANRQLAALTLLPKAAIKALQAQRVLAAEAWSPGDAGRALLLLRALAAGADPALAFDLYRGGDSLEQQAVVKALILLPKPETGWRWPPTPAAATWPACSRRWLATTPTRRNSFPISISTSWCSRPCSPARRRGVSPAWNGAGAQSWNTWWPPTPASDAPPAAACPTTSFSYCKDCIMKMFDPHIHMTSRTTDDYQAMSRAGISVVVEPAFWMGQPRRHVGSFDDYFLSLLGWERFRAAQFGIRHFCTGPQP
ncbi:hypothetical protein JOS77_12860 [Chromobacterium haemolyticum]|nr:hypothetical protein JOS77_12860 [Chromobacterium haemolyticum]